MAERPNLQQLPVDDRRFPWTAVPAAVALTVCVVLTAVVLLKSSRPDVAALRARAEASLAAGDTATAQLDFQHLLAIEPKEPRHAYDLARTLDAMKRRREAFAVLGTIAPTTGVTTGVTGGGYPPAHLLAAEWIIEARVLGGVDEPEALRAAVLHLNAASVSLSLQSRVSTLRGVLNGLLTPPTSRPS